MKVRHVNYSITQEEKEIITKSEDMRQGNKHWVTYSSLDQIREELCFEKAAFMTVMSSERDSLAKLKEQS